MATKTCHERQIATCTCVIDTDKHQNSERLRSWQASRLPAMFFWAQLSCTTGKAERSDSVAVGTVTVSAVNWCGLLAVAAVAVSTMLSSSVPSVSSSVAASSSATRET